MSEDRHSLTVQRKREARADAKRDAASEARAMPRGFHTRQRELVPVSDLAARCRDAAAAALRGSRFSPEDREDCKMHLLTAVLETLPVSDAKRQSDATRRAKTVRRDLLASKPKTVREVRTLVRRLADLEREAAKATAPRIPDGLPPKLHAKIVRDLYRDACNYRRTLERQRERDAYTYSGEGFTPHTEDPGPEVRGTVAGAKATAAAMLNDLGLLGSRDGLPALASVAYGAARAAAGLESAEVARELGLTAATYRQHVSRAAAKIPSAAGKWRERRTLPLRGVETDAKRVGRTAARVAHAAALDLPDWARSVKPAKSREDAANLPNDWRTRGPIYTVRTRSRKPNPRRTPADWTRTLSPKQRARLELKSEARRARAEARATV